MSDVNGYVALTFDDGPWGSTAQLLDTLRASGARATLFNWGEHAADDPSMVAAEVAAGMWVQNHGYTHSHMLLFSEEEMRDELERTNQVLVAAGAPRPTIFRPPFGERDAVLERVAAELGLLTLNWDVDTADWDERTAEEIVEAASAAEAGDVLLMHDWPPATLAAIPRIVADLRSRGLEPGAIDPVTGRAVAPND
jgi:peptidoglycan/xylan/chitin deacetylase (PgdA/CDA1 family)